MLSDTCDHARKGSMMMPVPNVSDVMNWVISTAVAGTSAKLGLIRHWTAAVRAARPYRSLQGEPEQEQGEWEHHDSRWVVDDQAGRLPQTHGGPPR